MEQRLRVRRRGVADGQHDERCGVGPTGHDGALPDFECYTGLGQNGRGASAFVRRRAERLLAAR